jgi:hypothetical protein
MNWIDRVFQVAGSLAAAVTLLGYVFGLGWYSLVPGVLAFLAASILVPFFLVVRNERLALKKRQNQGKRKKNSSKRTSRPAPAVSIGARAPSAERGGRVLAALPAAPL